MSLEDALQRYWDAAYAEGREGRDHDTEDGVAGLALRDVMLALADMLNAERAAERERWHAALGACDAALALCQPCAEPDCRAVQREYIDEARAAAADLLRA